MDLIIRSEIASVFGPPPLLFFGIGTHLTSKTGYTLRFPFISTNPYRWPSAEHTTKVWPFWEIAEKADGCSPPFPLCADPISFPNPVIFAKVEVPKACAILSATAGFSQTTREYGGSGMLPRLKPAVCSTLANITSDLDALSLLSWSSIMIHTSN